MKPKEVLAFAKENGAKMLDMRFMDFPGLWQHFTIPVDKLDEDIFEDGLGFDGSSIRGWQAINESDMLVVPEPETAFLDPFCAEPTLSHDLQHPGPDHPRGLHPRPAQRRPEGRSYLKSTGHRRHGVHRARRRSSSSSTTSASTRTPTAAYYYIDSDRGRSGTAGRDEEAEPGLQAALQGRLLPGAAGRPAAGHPQRDDAR